MKPTDYPVEHIADTEGTLVGMADMQRQRARAALAGRIPEALNGHFGDRDLNEHSSRLATAAGYYESALAYYEAARMAARALNLTMADLDRLAAREAASEPTSPPEPAAAHVWPIPELENTTDCHLDANTPILIDEHERFPKWGIELEGPDDMTMHLSLGRNGFGPDMVSLYISSLDDHGTRDHVMFPVPVTHIRALGKLADRIEAGLPIPWNLDGDIYRNDNDEFRVDGVS